MSDHTIHRVQSAAHVEQSASIDPNVSQNKGQPFGPGKKKRRRRQPDDELQEQAITDTNKDSDHIDYRA